MIAFDPLLLWVEVKTEVNDTASERVEDISMFAAGLRRNATRAIDRLARTRTPPVSEDRYICETCRVQTAPAGYADCDDCWRAQQN